MSDWIAAALSQNSGLVGYVFLIGPVCCVIVGIALAAPRRIAPVLTPLAAFFSGAALGLVVSFDDPSAARNVLCGRRGVIRTLADRCRRFCCGGNFERPWFPIAGRIFGSVADRDRRNAERIATHSTPVIARAAGLR